MALDLTTLTLAVADNLDATATATVSGAGAGGTVAVYRAPWNHQSGGIMAWTLAASAVADGSGNAVLSAIATTPGFYVWQAVRLATATTADRLSSACFRPVIDTADPIHQRVLDAVVTLVRSLNLDGIGSAVGKVFRRWYPAYIAGVDDVSPGMLPMIQVSPYPAEVPLGLLTGKDDIGYPVVVAFFDSVNQTYDDNMPRNLKWRRQVAAAFRSQQLAGVPEIVITQVRPDVITNVPGLKDGYKIGALTFTFTSRESRGLIA